MFKLFQNRIGSREARAARQRFEVQQAVLPAMVILQAAVAFALERPVERIWAERTVESAVALVAWVVAMRQLAGLVRYPLRREISIPSIYFCFRSHGQRKQNSPI